MLLMHGPAPAGHRSGDLRSSRERGRTPNDRRVGPLASSSPVRSNLELCKKSTPAVKRVYRPLKVLKRTKYSVALSHWHSLSDFFVQLGIHKKLLNDLTDQLAEALERDYSPRPTFFHSIAPMCMARWRGDGNWYRAELLDEEGGLVRFVDFGNLEVVGRAALHDLPPLKLFTDTEALAIRCSLSGLRLLPGVDDVNDLSHSDGQSLGDWFKSSLSTCDIVFTGNIFDDTHEVVLIQHEDGQLLSERIVQRYPQAFALTESGISLRQLSGGASESDDNEAEHTSPAEETKSTTVNDGDEHCSQMGIEEMRGEDIFCGEFGVNDFVDARIVHLDPNKLDMAFVLPDHLVEKRTSVTVACRQECSIAPTPRESAFVPGAKFIFLDPRDKEWYRVILIKSKLDDDSPFKLFLMDVGRLETFEPSTQLREMPICLIDIGPLATCVQIRRRPSRLAVNDHVTLVLASVDAIPLVDVFSDYDDYLTAKKEDTEHRNSSRLLNTNDHFNPSRVLTSKFQVESQKREPTLSDAQKEAPAIAKVAQGKVTERDTIIQSAPSTILTRNAVEAGDKEGQQPMTPASRKGTDFLSSKLIGKDKDGASDGLKTINTARNDLVSAINNDPIRGRGEEEGAGRRRKLRVPQVGLSSGDSILVHLEIDSLINDPLNFVLMKDCGSEFPTLLDEMSARDKTLATDIHRGDHCLFVDSSGRLPQYHRVEVVETDEKKKTAKVIGLDQRGSLREVGMSELFELVVEDVRLARVAVSSRLCPDYYKLEDWDAGEIRQCLRKYAHLSTARQHLLLRAHVIAFNHGVATVHLFTRNDSSDLITEALCSARQKRISAQRAAANGSATIPEP